MLMCFKSVSSIVLYCFITFIAFFKSSLFLILLLKEFSKNSRSELFPLLYAKIIGRVTLPSKKSSPIFLPKVSLSPL